MGSISPPPPSSSPRPKSKEANDSSQDKLVQVNNSEQTPAPSTSVVELTTQIRLRDQEIISLKSELERYKLALSLQEHSGGHPIVQKASIDSSVSNVGLEDLLTVAPNHRPHIETILGPGSSIDHDDDSAPIARSSDIVGEVEDDLVVVESDAKESDNPLTGAVISGRSSCAQNPLVNSESFFSRTSLDDDYDDNIDNTQQISEERADSEMDQFQKMNKTNHDVIDINDEDFSGNSDLDDIINDVGEIDLNLGLDDDIDALPSSDEQVLETIKQQHDENLFNRDNTKQRLNSGAGTGSSFSTQDEEALQDGLLLTSLTDAAISNLSQLAALQERCESQQQHSQHRYQSRVQPKSQQHGSNLMNSTHSPTVDAPQPTPTTPDQTYNPLNVMSHQQYHRRPQSSNDFMTDIFSSTTCGTQNLHHPPSTALSPHVGLQQQQLPMSMPSSSTPSLPTPSPVSMQQSTDLGPVTTRSLASVVAAAAVAAAAANDQHHPQASQHQVNTHQRLISSAMASPEFYHLLHQHYNNAGTPQHTLYQHSPVSPALHHFSPSSSATPSSSTNVIGTHSSLSSAISSSISRRSASAASSNLMSPIASPNYLRRQFMNERFPILSPSPSSGLVSGSTTACSNSSASPNISHIIQHQQRSGSALSGTSSSPAPMSSSIGSATVSPLMNNKNSSQARLNNMQIRHKFGYLGSNRGQFNSPHGFCLGLNQEIVVADTNNHRVCIFDKSGTYITQFGTPGKEEGQLWNPRKVAILHKPTHGFGQTGTTNSRSIQANITSTSHSQQQHSSYTSSQPLPNEPLYVVCDRGSERSRMQIFTKDGTFIKKIGIQYIDIVAGLAIAQNGLIIVVDSVSPTVYIINGDTGVLDGWFDCSGHMKEPSDIAVKSDCPGNEYFICDFKGHCVVVFSEQGEYLRKIGHDGLTSYPNGIDISDDGDILVGDSHGNRFHVVVFDRNGSFVSQFECPHVKVSRCCGLKITREGYIVTLAKNNHHVLVLDTIHI